MARGTKKGRPVKGGANVRWSGDKEGIDQERDCGGPKRCGRDPNDLNDGFPILIKAARLHHFPPHIGPRFPSSSPEPWGRTGFSEDYEPAKAASIIRPLA